MAKHKHKHKQKRKNNSPSARRYKLRMYDRIACRSPEVLFRAIDERGLDAEQSLELLKTFAKTLRRMAESHDNEPPFIDRAMARACEGLGIEPPAAYEAKRRSKPCPDCGGSGVFSREAGSIDGVYYDAIDGADCATCDASGEVNA